MEESIKKLSESMGDLSTRLKRVEESITKSEPTIEEFITIKHKVVGAGIFGKWVWAGAGAIIGVLAAARREIFAWFAG
ncbi:tail length tape-measure protein [Escherichia phage phi G17]|uniref:Tail length tape-measure protein n=1 Tax=Escherichia phage phi G17 TaxID=2234086 RepID=A0A2Z4PZV5_9CAUD|nr:tail length tape-measure protein [Escherichia phage phi G17]AWY03368.1 tail length tape-measure protein [Escherichia phage phi G17]